MSAPARVSGDLVAVRIRPGESPDEFNRRVLDTAPPLNDRDMAVVRRLLPPVRHEVSRRTAA